MQTKIKRLEKKQTETEEEDTPLLLVSPRIGTGQLSAFEENLSRARSVLYISHLSAKFTEIGWQFCIILFLSALTGYQSLALVSTYGLFSGLIVFLAGSSAGAFVDHAKYTRLHIIQLFIVVQNLSVIIASTCFFFLLRMVKETDLDPIQVAPERFLASGTATVSRHIFSNFVPPLNARTISLLVAIHVFGALAKLADEGITIALERDWIVVMSKVAASDNEDDDECFGSVKREKSIQSNAFYSIGSISLGDADGINTGVIRKLKEKSWLSETNTTMKQIDLLCKVLAPAAAGIFLSAFDNNDPTNSLATDIQHWYNLSYAAVIVGVMNLGSLCVEYSCTKNIYYRVPLLSARNEVDETENTEEKKSEIKDSSSNIGCGIFSLPQSLSVYLQQPVASGGIALSLLYLNVLSFGGLMTAYLVWLGVNYSLIGTLRGFSAVVGLLGTVAFRVSERQHGLANTGMWSIMVQFGFLALCYLSLFVRNLEFSLWLLVIGVCCSRIGLWAFDLTITQYMQQQTPEKVRGLIGGVQKSLNSFFELSTFALGLIFPDPGDFYLLVATGYTSVGIAMMLYYFGIYKKREALI